MKRVLLSIITFGLCLVPQVNAMRFTKQVFLARAIQRSSMPAITTEFNKSYRQDYQALPHNPFKAAFAGAGLAGAALLQTFAQEEEKPTEQVEYVSIEGLSFNDIKGLANALDKACPSDQLELARQISGRITHYTTGNIITLLQSADDAPRKILVKAISNNITYYSPVDIRAMLTADRSVQTHTLIAAALQKNYDYFTKCSFMGVHLYSSKQWHADFLNILGQLRCLPQKLVLQEICKDIHQFNLFDVLQNSDPFYKTMVLKAFTESKQVTIEQYTQDLDTKRLLQMTQGYNQTHLASEIARSIDRYNEWYFADFVEYCSPDAQTIIFEAIARDIQANPAKYKKPDTITWYIKKYPHNARLNILKDALEMKALLEATPSLDPRTRMYSEADLKKIACRF